jgi:hypothetical protein
MKRVVPVLALVVVLLVLLLVPPLVSIGRYKSRITQLVSTSLGRPVRLSSAELRLLPRPGFVITDLTVEEDPAYGAEPVLHATTVVASIRLLSLWRGRLELSRISVDEASLNVVRNAEGHWNLDPFVRAAITKGAPQGPAPPTPPYLEATNSRINVKKGIEKLPYSLVNADLSFWQENGGEWRVRLRGQPARTDVSLDLADTGIVRLEGRLHRAVESNQMPIHLDIDWREAQLGQLSRLVLGSDPGWRGALTGQMQVDGTVETAQVKARLAATGVHRAEFAPPDALDFDANCNFTYHYFARSVEKLSCDSPLGEGHIVLTGDLPGDQPARFSVEAQRVPVSAGLDVLRTLRSGFNSDLEASGTMSGQIAYDPTAANADAAQNPSPHTRPSRKLKKSLPKEPRSSLSGSLTVSGLRLSGGGLSQPLQAAKSITLQPAESGDGQPDALTATIPVQAGGSVPMTVGVQFASAGYQATLRGSVSLSRLRELARMAGIADVTVLEGLAGEPATLDLRAEGSWLPAPSSPPPPAAIAGPSAASLAGSLDGTLSLRDADTDQLSGTVTLHDANWRSDILANHVSIEQAVLHLGDESIVWDPIQFSEGPVKGTASFQPAPLTCPADKECLPQLDLRFEALDAAQLQAALLGARQQSTVISELIQRFSASSAPAWPRINSSVTVDHFRLGPVTIDDASITLRVLPDGVEFTNVAGGLLGGHLSATGKLTKGDKPSYTLQGQFEKASPQAVCRLFALRCTGGLIDAQGRVELAGFTDRDLAASVNGSLHFEWRHGSLGGPSVPASVSKELVRFDRWTADARIAANEVSISSSEVQHATNKTGIDATVTFADTPSVRFAVSRTTQSARQ